jgi:hypothetical protein
MGDFDVDILKDNHQPKKKKKKEKEKKNYYISWINLIKTII